jgi:hypothetical protein
MKLNTLICSAILNYPSLHKDENFHKSKLKVLDHLYFVIGNGFRWKNGQLVELSFGTREPRIIVTHLPEEFFTDYKILRKDRHGIPNYSIENGFLKETRWWEENSYYPVHFYPLCENYSNVFLIPDNVKKDYMEGAIFVTAEAKKFYTEMLTVEKTKESYRDYWKTRLGKFEKEPFALDRIVDATMNRNAETELELINKLENKYGWKL